MALLIVSVSYLFSRDNWPQREPPGKLLLKLSPFIGSLNAGTSQQVRLIAFDSSPETHPSWNRGCSFPAVLFWRPATLQMPRWGSFSGHLACLRIFSSNTYLQASSVLCHLLYGAYMQIWGPHPRSTESEALGVGPKRSAYWLALQVPAGYTLNLRTTGPHKNKEDGCRCWLVLLKW